MGASRTRRVTAVYLILQGAAAVLALWLSQHFEVARLATTLVALVPTLPGAYLAWAAFHADRDEAAVDIDAKVKALAAAVAAAEAQQRGQLIGAGAHRINVTFTHRPEIANNATGSASQGVLTDIVGYYQGLQPARLVITGGPGAGKTLLAVELILGLLTHPDRIDTDPVPVRLSLAGWDAVSPLSKWLADQIYDQFHDRGISPADARRLVLEHRILPVLDGLDEMDTGTTPAGSRRATHTVKQLNNYQTPTGNAPVVLTCRTIQYEELAALDVRMREAARIEIDPVTPAQATAYLAARTTNPTRWRTVLDTLTVAPGGTLARALGTPWRLNLAATAYEEPRADVLGYLRDPDHLLTLASPSAVRDHLLELHLPAAVSQHAHLPSRYRPDQVHRWLAALAVYLATAPEHGSGGTDIVLHRLWPMAGLRLVRASEAFLAFLFALSFATLFLTQVPIDSSRSSLLGAALTALLGLAVVWVASRPTVPAPQATQLHRLRSRTHLLQLTKKAALGFTCGLMAELVVAGSAFGAKIGLAAGLAAGLVCGFAAGLVGGLAEPLTSDVTPTDPRDPVRDDFVVGIAFVLVVGLAVGVGLGLAAGPVAGLASGLTAGVMGGLACGLYFLTGAGRRYFVFLCCCRGRLPWRLGTFLNWAYQAGLLRISGVAYQFRHRELQDWITAHPHL